EISVVRAAEILALCRNAVVLDTAAAEVVVLEIPSGFRKSELVKFVVIAVHRIEHLYHGAAPCLRRGGIVARRRISGRRIPRRREYTVRSSGFGSIDTVR